MSLVIHCCLMVKDFSQKSMTKGIFSSNQFSLVIAPYCSNNHQDVHEEVDHVQVDVQGGKDVLLGAEGVLVTTAHHQLGVVHDVQGENQGSC